MSRKEARPLPDRRVAEYVRAYRQLCRQLLDTGFLLKGSVQLRWLTCGQPSCACGKGSKADRHGPYYYWTSKVQGKTVALMLSEDEGKLYMGWAKDRKRLERTLEKMYRISGIVARIKLGKRPPWLRK
jgi:hypothetical protein